MMPGPEAEILTRRVAAGAGWAQVSRLAEVFSSLILSLLLVRVLGPERYGQYAFVVNAATMGAVILSLGFADTLMRFVSALFAQNAVPQARFLVRRLLLARIGIYTVGVLALAAFHDPAARALHLPLVTRYWVPIAALLVSQGAVEFATSLAYARLRSRDVAVARTIGQLLAAGFFLAMVSIGHTDPVTATLTVILSYVSAAGLLLLGGLGALLLQGPSSRRDVPPFRGFALAAWGISLGAIGLAGQIDVILLGALRKDVAQIAFYSVVTLVFLKLGILLSGWAGTATASVAELQTRRGPQATRRFLGAYVRMHLLLSLLVYPPVIVLAGEITQRVFGPAYGPAAGLMAAYGGFWLLSALAAAGIPLSFLLGLGRQRQAVAIRGLTGLVNVVLDIVLIPPMGALGAIIATGTANGLAHVSDFIVTARHLQVRYPWRFATQLGVVALVASIPGLVLRPHTLLTALAASALYFSLFAVGLLIFRPLLPIDVELAGRVNRRAARVVGRLASIPAKAGVSAAPEP